MRSLRFATAMFFFLLVAGCASTLNRGTIGNVSFRPDYSSQGMEIKDGQYFMFKQGEKVWFYAEIKEGYRGEWYYNGKPRSCMRQLEFVFQYPIKKAELKLYTFKILPEAKSGAPAPVDSVICHIEVK
jgi:hypothetical protein